MTAPEPAGIAGPLSPDEVIAMATQALEKGSRVTAEGGQEEEEVGEVIVPSDVVLAKPVADWARDVATTLADMPPVPATMMVKQFSEISRRLRDATMRKDAHEVATLSVVAGAMLLGLYLVAIPHLQRLEEGEPPPEPSRIIQP